ncbi:MAG: MFS transporter [Candidatus Aenigmatarchaeota archaeon]
MSLQRNIPLIYISSGLMWRFFVPVLALFYIASQVPIEEFAIILSVFALVTLALEIPSGVVADLLGKKRTLLVARFIYIIEIILLAFFNGFWLFLVAKILSGVAVSMTSGTNTALLYDTLKKLGREKENKKVYGNLTMITHIFMAFIFVAGGFLFSIDPKLPAIATIPLVVAGFILTFFLEEPYKNKKKLTIKNSFIHLKESFVYLKKHNYVKLLVLYSAPIIGTAGMLFSLSSVYFEIILIPVYLLGIIAFFTAMSTALASRKAHVFEEKLGEKKSLIVMQLISLIGLGLIALMVNYFGVIFYFFVPIVFGFSVVVVSDYMNKRIETSHRVTLLSIKNMIDNLWIFILFPIIGFWTKTESMQASFSYLWIVIVIYLAFLVLYFKKLRIRL